MSSKFAIENENVLQLLGDFRPPDPLICAVQKFPLKALVFTRETSNVKRKIERKFSVPTKIGQIFGGFGGLGVRGFKKLRFLLQKARPCVNSRRLSHFASKSVEGCDLQVGWGKTQKVTEPPIGKTCRR